MSEEEKVSGKVYQFPDWASKTPSEKSITRKLYSIRDLAKRVSDEYGGSPGPKFWATIREKIKKIKG